MAQILADLSGVFFSSPIPAIEVQYTPFVPKFRCCRRFWKKKNPLFLSKVLVGWMWLKMSGARSCSELWLTLNVSSWWGLLLSHELQNSLGSEFTPKIKFFGGELVLFISVDRLDQAPGETFWQRLSTCALVPARNENGFGLWHGNSFDSLLFSPVLQGNKLMGSYSCVFLFVVSLCVTSGPSAPISSRTGRGLEVFKEWRCCKQEAAVEGWAGNQFWTGVGRNNGLQRCCPLSAPASPEPLSHLFAALCCLNTIREVYMSFEAQIVFPRRQTKWKKVRVPLPETCCLYGLLTWARVPLQWRWPEQGLEKVIPRSGEPSLRLGKRLSVPADPNVR